MSPESPQTKYLNTRFALGSVEASGAFKGYGSVFNVIDDHGSVVAPGAFTNTLRGHKATGTLPKLLWQHDTRQPIGVFTAMLEDGTGLSVEGQLCLDTVMGREAYALLKLGAIDGLSIGFRTKASRYDQKTGVLTLTEIELWEVSLVTFPSNPDATIESLKSAKPSDVRQLETALRERLGFSRSEAKAIASRGWQGIASQESAAAQEQNAALLAAIRSATKVFKTPLKGKDYGNGN